MGSYNKSKSKSAGDISMQTLLYMPLIDHLKTDELKRIQENLKDTMPDDKFMPKYMEKQNIDGIEFTSFRKRNDFDEYSHSQVASVVQSVLRERCPKKLAEDSKSTASRSSSNDLHIVEEIEKIPVFIRSQQVTDGQFVTTVQINGKLYRMIMSGNKNHGQQKFLMDQDKVKSFKSRLVPEED